MEGGMNSDIAFGTRSGSAIVGESKNDNEIVNMLTKIPQGYKEAMMDRKEIKSKGLASAVGRDVGVNKNSVILDLDDQ